MLLKGKKALIMGVANNRSIAYGISSAFAREGARLAFSYAGDAIKKRVEPICEELGGEFTFPCDVSSDAEIAAAAEKDGYEHFMMKEIHEQPRVVRDTRNSRAAISTPPATASGLPSTSPPIRWWVCAAPLSRSWTKAPQLSA